MNQDKFEALCRKARMVPTTRVNTSEGDILVASSHRITTEDFPDGCYRVMWVVSRGELDIAHDLYFDANHDPELIEADRFKARISTGLADAMGWMNLNMESGRYGH